jgi:hypothetical protein
MFLAVFYLTFVQPLWYVRELKLASIEGGLLNRLITQEVLL